MKKNLWPLLIMTIITNVTVQAQSIPAEQVAIRIADRLRDSLSLSAEQRSGIYAINMQLHERKMNVRQQYASTPEQWTELIQRIENTRDSLYRPVLASEELYQRYKSKKSVLIRVN